MFIVLAEDDTVSRRARWSARSVAVCLPALPPVELGHQLQVTTPARVKVGRQPRDLVAQRLEGVGLGLGPSRAPPTAR